MNLTNARKQAYFAAIISIVVGTLVLIGVGVAFALYGKWLSAYAQEEPNAATNAYLIKAVKAFVFRMSPALAMILVTSGGCTLYLLKKDKEHARLKRWASPARLAMQPRAFWLLPIQ